MTTLPSGFDELWAKSAGHAQSRGETVPEHTRNVLLVLSGLYRLRPHLTDILDCPDFWHRAFWACFLHDWGKSAGGFQRQVREQDAPWRRRHEVLSLAFVHWLLDTNDADYEWIVAAIASHHKDLAYIAERYPMETDIEDDLVSAMIADIPDAVLDKLWDFLAQFGSIWRDQLGFSDANVQILLPKDKALALASFRRDGRQAVHTALHRYKRFARRLSRGDADSHDIRVALALRGTVINADHLGSAHVLHIVATPLRGVDHTLELMSRSWDGLYEHQREAARHIGSAVLRAPTGSGKTEAAVLWASGQAVGKDTLPRLFYVLPFQASMNAMRDRLVNIFGNCVGLQHGRSLHALYRRLLDQEPSPADAEREARRANNLARLHHLPIRVLSPYQLLKACYRLRGYEAILADLYGAAFILDEIHAYEPGRLALIINSSFRCIRRLRQAEQRLLGPHAAAVGPRSRWVDGRCGPFLCEYGPEVGSHAERACA